MKMKWLGPFRIMDYGKSPNAIVIEMERGKTSTVNKMHLAPWHTRLAAM
jgi:hypothetical protein